MQPWTDGEVRYAQGSAAKPYQMKFIGGTYSCSCMAWRNQSKPIDQRTCKHLKKENGDAFEAARIGGAPPPLAVSMSCSVKPGFKTRILIRFRNDDHTYQTLGSPLFEAPRDLWEDEELDGLVVDGDDETGFCISCDAEGTKDPKTGVHTIVWLMFEPNVHGWVQDLHRVWKRRMRFELPSVEKWAWTDLEKELAGCACHQGGTCDVSHDPASCTCVQCRTAEAKTAAESPEDIIAQVMGAKPTMRSPEFQETPVPLKGDGIERDKAKRINQYGGFIPFTDREKAVIVAEEEAKKGRKLRQDEKADLFGPPVLLANKLEDHEDLDPTGWLESEKLDGVRAYWNGECFVSRQGNVYSAPGYFIADLPKQPLDGELWMGRKQFQKTISVVKRQVPGPEWKQVKFVLFDAPICPGGFEQRLAHLGTLALGSYASVHPHSVCKSRKDAEEHLKAAAALGAEGLMLRKPGSAYEPRRSSTLLKMKPFQDAEAVVIGYEPGKKANKGKTGGLIVQMPNGKTFNVGTGLTAKDRDNPPAIGATITYRFTELTDDGKPKCVSYVATRDYE